MRSLVNQTSHRRVQDVLNIAHRHWTPERKQTTVTKTSRQQIAASVDRLEAFGLRQRDASCPTVVLCDVRGA